MKFNQYSLEQLLDLQRRWEDEANSLEEELRECEKYCEEIYNEIDKRRDLTED